MQKLFIVSLIKNGLLGGYIVANDHAIIFRTGKATVPQKYRNLKLEYKEICEASIGRLFLLPTVSVTLYSGEAYKFAVFFGKRRFVDILKQMGVGKQA